MNLKTTLLVLLTLFTTFAKTHAKETIIKGKIEGKLPEAVYYSLPVNGSLGFDAGYSLKPDAEGNFTIKADLLEITFIDIYYNYQPAGFIIATPGGIYGITITENKGKVTHVITGKDSEAQKLYNTLAYDHRMSLIDDLARKMKGKTAQAVKQQLEEQEKADVAAFKKLLDSGVISQDFYNNIKAERGYFYATVTGYTGTINYNLALRGEEFDFTNMNALWCDVYTKHPADGKMVRKTPWGFLYLNGYQSFKRYEETGFDPTVNMNTDNIGFLQIIENIVPAQNLEYYTAAYLHEAILQGTNDKNLITIFEDFKITYPKSGYITYFEPKIAAVKDFHKISTELTGNTAFVNDYSKVNSVDELIKKFSGRKVYIDVWATWCGPCRQEFKHKDSLYKLLKEHDITVVYISIDDDKEDDRWKKMINLYGLEGSHIRANKQLGADLRKLFNKGGGIAIPWYMLVDATGKMTRTYAAPPSKIERLKEDISAM